MYKIAGIQQGYIIYEWRGDNAATATDLEKISTNTLGTIDVNKSTERKVYLKLKKSEDPMFLRKK
tara:strand:+ start:1866 stop:2060 length:195 start_codon:yes stop_codon:yes gene_type:complete